MFHWQERTWTCGPAALAIALNRIGIKKTESHLARLLLTSKKNGTKNKNFPLAAKHYRLDFVAKNNSSLAEMAELIRSGYQVIVCYFSKINNSGHYALVRKVGSDSIFLSDPSLGPNTRYKNSYFKTIWYNQRDQGKRWLFAVKKFDKKHL